MKRASIITATAVDATGKRVETDVFSTLTLDEEFTVDNMKLIHA